MKATMERELKFDGNDEVDLDRLGGEPLEPHTFSSTYYDTRDRRLLRARITLRRRVENGLGVWQLKLPHEGARLEVEDVGGPTAPPSSIAAVLSGVLRGQPV